MPLVENRYAEALIKIGLDENLLDALQDDLKDVKELVAANDELRKALINPGISSGDKKSVVEKLFKKLNPSTINFIKLLIDKGRITLLSDIIDQYVVLADKIRECLNIKVITSIDVTKEQLDKISEKFRKMYGSKQAKVEHVVDPSIIGGIIVRIGDKMVDGSVKGKLGNMSSVLR